MVNSYGRNYRIEESKNYEEFNRQLSEVNFPIYIISGTPYWKKYMVDKLSESIGRRPENVNENIKPFLEKMRYKSLKKKKHFILFESKGNKLKEADFKALREYFAEPSENGVLVIQLHDWIEKKFYLNAFRMLKRSNRIKMIEMDFTNNTFKSIHILKRIENLNINFESEKLKKEVIKNLSLNLEELEDNIMTLETFDGSVISENDYITSIEKYSDNTIDKFYDSLTFVNRKTVPYKIIKEFLDDGRSPNSLLRGIEKHFNLLYQAKYLRVEGIMRPHDIEEEKLKIYEESGINFNKPNIWDLSKYKRSRYLEDCAEISIKEIIYVLMLIEEAYIVKRVSRNGAITYTKYTNRDRLMKLIMKIMIRREHED